jgi:hypothetical protein
MKWIKYEDQKLINLDKMFDFRKDWHENKPTIFFYQGGLLKFEDENTRDSVFKIIADKLKDTGILFVIED